MVGGTYCAAPKCGNNTGSGFRLFRFPRDEQRRKQWLLNCRWENWWPSDNHRLCEAHFEENQFELSRVDGKKPLKWNAVPTIFNLPNPPKRLSMKRSLNLLCKQRADQVVPEVDHIATKRLCLSQKENYPPTESAGSSKDTPLQQSSQETSSQTTDSGCRSIEVLQTKIKNLQRQLRIEKNKSANLQKNLARFLNPDQVHWLKTKKTSALRSITWSNQTVKASLRTRCATGVQGYEHLRREGYPLPSYRTLCARVESAKFAPGVQKDVMQWLKIKTESLPAMGKDCILALDEMQLRPTVEYDKGLGCYVGQVSEPFVNANDKPATHALVFILRGIAAEWKQTVAYYLTGNSTSGQLLWQVTKEVIKAANDIGLFVRVVVSDMGPANCAMWKIVGIESTKTSLKNFIADPCREECSLYFMADPPHLIKSLRNCLLAQTIILSPLIVIDENLPSEVVSLEPIKQLIDLQKNMDLKLAPKLKEIHVHPGTFQKMKVNLAAQIFSHSTASALKACVERQLFPPDTVTTSWFLQTMSNWFDYLNARFSLASLFASSTVKIAALEDVMIMFQQMRFGGSVDGWKPIQTGIRLSTQSVIDLHEDLVINGNYKFLMTGRLTQDCVENLFSQIRSKGDSHPSPVHFRHSLRLISISQYMHATKYSSYDSDDSVYFLDFLKTRKSDIKSAAGNVVEQPIDCSASLPLSECEANALYTVAGWAVFKETNRVKSCPSCLACITGDLSTAPEHSLLTTLKSFEQGKGLTHPSPAVLKAIIAAESIFKANQNNITKIPNVQSFLFKAFTSQFSATSAPVCHDIIARVVKRYYNLRLNIHSARVTHDHAAATMAAQAVQHASRSAHCRTKVN